jgi:hypothetical protein
VDEGIEYHALHLAYSEVQTLHRDGWMMHNEILLWRFRDNFETFRWSRNLTVAVNPALQTTALKDLTTAQLEVLRDALRTSTHLNVPSRVQ